MPETKVQTSKNPNVEIGGSMESLTKEDLQVLMDALDLYGAQTPLGINIPPDAVPEMIRDQFRTAIAEAKTEARTRNERACLLKAKLIQIRDARTASDFVDSATKQESDHA